MQAPSIGGVIVPRGDGNTVVRVRQGASMSDFADKINANPASLVTVLFNLGEMATATQSLDQDTFEALGAEDKELFWIEDSNQRFYAYNHFGQHPEKLIGFFDEKMA